MYYFNRKESPARKKLSETEELLGLTHESSTGIRETTASTDPGNIHVAKQLLASFLRHCVQEKFRPVLFSPFQCMPIIFMTHRSFSVILSSHIGNPSECASVMTD